MAKKFRFRLQTVLRVRELREREALRRMAEKQGELLLLDQLDDATRADIAAAQDRLRDAQEQAALSPVEMTRARAWIAHLRRTMLERETVRRELQGQLERLRADWRRAQTQKRVIEKLRERRASEHARGSRRREEAQMEEVARGLLLHTQADSEGV
ncbi:MAG: hypothetical protein KDA32_11105 [Phycisphaerales bacterium]|nr:hypothetical protein [Phycisphaerales bacterium]